MCVYEALFIFNIFLFFRIHQSAIKPCSEFFISVTVFSTSKICLVIFSCFHFFAGITYVFIHSDHIFLKVPEDFIVAVIAAINIC